jgi:hypothetical protein
MNIKLFRLLSFLILSWMLFTKAFILVGYWFVFVVLVEFLNLQHAYKSKDFKKFNALFFFYLLFITIVRTIPYKTSAINRYIVNTIEHLLFSLIICLIIYFIIEIVKLYKERTALLRIIVTAVAFYVVGIMNEVYQNIAVGEAALVFDKGSWIDLVVNLFGAAGFILLAYKFSSVPKRVRS